MHLKFYWRVWPNKWFWSIHTAFKENPDQIRQAKVISEPEKCSEGFGREPTLSSFLFVSQ